MDACPFKSWAAFTDDSGSQPHTNLVTFVDRTDCVLSLPGRNKREPLIEFLAAATPRRVEDLLAERDALLDACQSVLNAETYALHVGYDSSSGGGAYVYADAVRTDDEAFGKVRTAIAKALGQDAEGVS